eukprot:m.51546 g.51546  ORF g.51546 m.51546 type:complete len:72 (-) comp10948_c2_seq1:624-839(-)
MPWSLLFMIDKSTRHSWPTEWLTNAHKEMPFRFIIINISQSISFYNFSSASVIVTSPPCFHLFTCMFFCCC